MAQTSRKVPQPWLGPSEQRTPEHGDPFEGGGRRADLEADWQQRKMADADYAANLDRARRWDSEASGTARTLDGTPWIGTGKGHPK